MQKAKRIKKIDLAEHQKELARKGELIMDNMTDTLSENILGNALLNEGVKVIAQHRLGKYTFDLKIKEYAILIEVDGFIHSSKDAKRVKDYRKDRYAIRRGFRVLRVANGEIEHDLKWVVKEIKQTISSFRKVPKEVYIVEYNFWDWFKELFKARWQKP